MTAMGRTTLIGTAMDTGFLLGRKTRRLRIATMAIRKSTRASFGMTAVAAMKIAMV